MEGWFFCGYFGKSRGGWGIARLTLAFYYFFTFRFAAGQTGSDFARIIQSEVFGRLKKIVCAHLLVEFAVGVMIVSLLFAGRH